MEKKSEQGSSTLIAMLNSMEASIGSRNGLLQELVSHKRSSPDDETTTSKRRTQCLQTVSDEDENRRRQKLDRTGITDRIKKEKKREKKSNKNKSFIRYYQGLSRAPP